MLNSAAMGTAAAAKQLLSPAWALGAASGCRSWNSLQCTAGYATGGSSGQGPGKIKAVQHSSRRVGAFMLETAYNS